MLREISIKNYKSILDDKIELGRLNVFIGENGCGKTNILEALAMAGAAKSNSLETEELYSRGIRIAKPAITFSSFLNQKKNSEIKIELKDIENDLARSTSTIRSLLVCENDNDIYSKWSDRIRWYYSDDELNHIRSLNPQYTDKYLDKVAKKVHEAIDKILNDEKLQSIDIDVNNKLKLNIALRSDNEKVEKGFIKTIDAYLIYSLNTQALRGIYTESRKLPLGINGEGLDILLSTFSKEELAQLKNYNHLISWLEEIVIDEKDALKFKGHKLGRSNSILYFRDKFMRRNNNLFAAENANEGALHILFYLALFISQKTPSLFAIDNIETGLNPRVCRTLIKELAKLAADNNKQALITTHNPAILDGLNLHDDEQRLFVVYRNDAGHTKTERVRLKPDTNGKDLKLSEMWMRGYLGGLPNNF